MFGEGKYPLVKTEDVCEYITKGTTPKSNEIIEEYEEGLIPYLKVYNLSFDGSMLFEHKPQYVTLETHNKFLARSKVFPNDVLMNIVGPPLGKFAIVPHTFSEWNINQAMAIFRTTDKINPVYLLHSLKQPRVLRPFIDLAVGVRQQNLSLLQCRNLEIPLPPIDLQNQFAAFVNQVDKLKFERNGKNSKIMLLYNTKRQINVIKESKYYSVFNIKDGDERYLLFTLHLPSRYKQEKDDLDMYASQIVREFEQLEEERNTENSIVVGDFNMNPFDSGMISGLSFNAVMCPEIAKKRSRKVLQEERKFYYNPMWHLMGNALNSSDKYE